MAKRGGYRVGSGRPKGSKNLVKVVPAPGRTRAVYTAVTDVGLMKPLTYMLRVMNDEQVSAERRDRMAIAAASYCHPRAVMGKKSRAAEAAETAGEGTDWGDDLVEAVN